MHIADREDGSHCGVQDPDQDCEEESGVADVRPSTASTTAGLAAGGGASIPMVPPRPERYVLVSRETFEAR